MDDVRAFVRSGIASPLEWSAQTALQFEIARRNAARMAADYVASGFTVVIDDVVHEGDLPQPAGHIGQAAPRKVLLSPSIFVVHRRNSHRMNKTFDTKILEPVATRLHGELLAKRPPSAGWVVLDTGTQSINDTVDTILKRLERPAVQVPWPDVKRRGGSGASRGSELGSIHL